MYRFTYVHMHLCALVHGVGQRSTSSVLLDGSSLGSRVRDLLNLDFPDWLDLSLLQTSTPSGEVTDTETEHLYTVIKITTTNCVSCLCYLSGDLCRTTFLVFHRAEICRLLLVPLPPSLIVKQHRLRQD